MVTLRKASWKASSSAILTAKPEHVTKVKEAQFYWQQAEC